MTNIFILLGVLTDHIFFQPFYIQFFQCLWCLHLVQKPIKLPMLSKSHQKSLKRLEGSRVNICQDETRDKRGTKGVPSKTLITFICHTNPHDLRPRSGKQAGTVCGFPAANGQSLIRLVIAVMKVTHTIRPQRLASTLGLGFLSYYFLNLQNKTGRKSILCQSPKMRFCLKVHVLFLCLYRAYSFSILTCFLFWRLITETDWLMLRDWECWEEAKRK